LLNHGLLTFGPTIHGALMRLYQLERACELEVIARSMGETPEPIDEYVIGKARERMQKTRNTLDYGLAAFQGLVRTVERKGAHFRR
jgi:ribulose-5-phosphate 4-epimerase/fuculose-1-phosphate aldolase